jgi:predicted metal-dependent hydrolase
MNRRDHEQLLSKGIEEFNGEKFFESHETFEILWNDQEEPERQFTQGLIQIAVALQHWRNRNALGARKLLARGLERIEVFSPCHKGVDVDRLYKELSVHLHTLIESSESDKCPPPPIKFPNLLRMECEKASEPARK